MWPTLLNMNREDCLRTLRRLELEAYSNMISVFRAQGALEDNRRKLLEELRAVLRIGDDRHSAEARRVANDELLATIAEHIAGPNTNLAWIMEGKRRVPLMPRGIPQTMYTDIADQVAEAIAAENKELKKKLEAEKLVAPKSNEEEMPEAEGETAEGFDDIEEIEYPPIATEDPAIKIWETEIISRKRKLPEGGAPDDAPTPVKNVRNIPINSNQKHVNLSQIYSKFSQPTTSKPSSQSKHSYNQVSKVSTNKTSQSARTGPTERKPRAPRQPRQPKQPKPPKQPKLTKAQAKKSLELMSPTKYTHVSSSQHDYSCAPNTFQASYAQAVLGQKSKVEYVEELKAKVSLSPGVSEPGPTPLDAPALPEHAAISTLPITPLCTPHRHTISGKPSQLVIKKKGEMITEKKMPVTELKLIQKQGDGIKLFANRPVVVASGSTSKTIATPGKFVTTKVIGPIAKSTASTPVMNEKVIVVSKPVESKTLGGSKIVIPAMSSPTTTVTAGGSSRIPETITPKGIPATDLKVSAKTFLLNPKPGQKMVVVPAKARTKTGPDGQQVPLIQLKGMSTPMRLVPVSSQPMMPVKSTNVTVVSQSNIINTLQSKPKIVGVEPIKTANMADIVPVKGLTPVTATRTNPIVRPISGKGSVIVVQKGTPISKPLTFTKNGNDMSKIIMGKNITQLMQASKETESAKGAGNVILLDLNNDQTARATTMSEILDSRGVDKKDIQKITEDTPVLFDTQMTDETCNASSLDSTVESIGEMVPMESIQSMPILEKQHEKVYKDSDAKDRSSSVTDWEMELDTVSRKDKDDDKLNSLHLDLGMSSDSDGDYIANRKTKKSPPGRIPRTIASESRETYESPSGLSHATRTLLSQLQDEGSSSNDSSFALKAKLVDKAKEHEKSELPLNKSECDALTKAKEKLTEKVAKSQQKRIDIYSTAISTADINLDSFSYLEEGMMDEELSGRESRREAAAAASLQEQLSRLLADDASTDSQQSQQSVQSQESACQPDTGLDTGPDTGPDNKQ